MMDGVEVGRVNVAARACGLANRAFELGVDYAQQRGHVRQADRRAPGRGLPSAEMATKVEAAHLMMVRAARTKTRVRATTLRPGWLAPPVSTARRSSRTCSDPRRLRLPKEYEIERLYREAPMLMIGEGTADIQRMIIARRLLEEAKAARLDT